VIIYLLLFGIAVADFSTPYNSDFVEVKYEKFDLIYPKSYSTYRDLVASKIEKAINLYEKSFGYKLGNRLKVILASERDQISNGYSTPVYTNKIVLFNGGSSGIDYFSSPSWLDTLINHEMAHTFQLNAQKSKVSRGANTIFGNTPFAFIHIFPNLFIPDAILEGNSVLNESIFGVGGRLWSGRAKALFTVGLPNLDAKRFMNNHLDFPFMEEKYIVGGFFQQFLYRRYSINRVNNFFLTHSQNYIPLTPLLLNDSFVEHFGSSFDTLFEMFLHSSKESAKGFKLESGEEIASSDTYFPISRDGKAVFITSSSGNGKPETSLISKESSTIEESFRRDGGRLFRQLDGEYLEARSSSTSPDSIESGLWSDGKFLEWSRGKVYLDYRNGSWLYIDVNSSIIKPHIWQDDKFIGTTSSSAMFDRDGNIYYFDQNSSNITLYKNREAILSFSGYYSKLADIDGEKVYFIANSKLGSTLYMAYRGLIFRVFQGDNILDGKLLNSQTFILTTVTEDGYQYIKKEIPENIAGGTPEFIDEVKNEFGDINFATLIGSKEKSYNSLTSLRFAELYLESGEKMFIGKAVGTFVDPLGYNYLSFGYSNFDSNKRGFINYFNQRYRLNYGLSGEYFELSDSYKASLQLDYSLYQMDNFGSSLNFQTTYDERYRDEFEWVAGVSIGDSELYGDALQPYLYSYIQPLFKHERVDSIGLKMGAGGDIWRETYISGSYSTLFSIDGEDKLFIELTDDVDDFGDISLEGLDLYPAPSRSLHRVSGTVSQTINLPLYFFKVPLSLRRERIFLRFNRLYEDRVSELQYIDEKVIGGTFELLVGHRLPLPITVKYIDNSLSGVSGKVILNMSF
jgi:hypothetical protein